MITESTHLDMVADAMMVAVSRQLFRANNLDHTPIEPIYSTDQALEAWLRVQTYGYCDLASAIVIYELTRYFQEFNVLALLTGTPSYNKPLTRGYSEHTYFLAHTRSGIWYAGSPANYIGSHIDPITALLQSEKLGGILKKIENLDGGAWPSERQIFRSLRRYDDPHYVPEENDSYWLQVTQFKHTTGGSDRTLAYGIPVKELMSRFER